MKFLVYGETPTIPTGTGLLSKNILSFLLELGHEIELCATNHFTGDNYDHTLYPFKIHPSPHNEAFNLEKAKYLIAHGEYDALLLSADLGQIRALADSITDAKQRKSFPVIMYSCTDTDLLNYQTFACLAIADYPVVYSQHSKRVAQRYLPALNIAVISPGCEPDVFSPLSEEHRQKARKELFDIEDDTFLVINVNRNQWRKDPGRSLMIFHEFYKTHPHSRLYMHMKMQDVGGSLPDAAQILGMKLDSPHAEVIFTQPSFNEKNGIPREILKLAYNCADVMISTSTGEGWGLTTCEAMAAGCPLVVPRNTSFIEIIGDQEERGYLAESGGDADHLAIPYGISDNARALVHADSMLEKLNHVYHNRDEANTKAGYARGWTLHHTWEHAREQWSAIFNEIGAI